MKYISLLLMLFVVACSGPDLIPVQEKPAYCDIENGNLKVSVQNIGDENAGVTYTDVTFGNLGTSRVMTPALGVGETTSFLVTIPMGCFNPDCGFQIIVDVRNEEDEKSESNNEAIGNCVG